MGDRQNRVGHKFGGGGPASAASEAVARKKRQMQLAMETIDLAKDPFFFRNHIGKYECKLCATLHNTEGNYLAHTQGRKHQERLARRAALEERYAPKGPGLGPAGVRTGPKKQVLPKALRIGRPGYAMTKMKDPKTGQRSVSFEIAYPEISPGIQPRHRFMSAYEQQIEPADAAWQYLVFAADPYETIAFKIPSVPLDKGEGKFVSSWDREKKVLSVKVVFMSDAEEKRG